jgi:ATP/maltotriose-dependent transcriptional regulator MalT
LPLVNVKLVNWGIGSHGVSTADVLLMDPMKSAMAADPADRTAQVAERALARLDAGAPIAPGSAGWNAIRALVAADRYDTALHALDQASEVAHESGGPFDVAVVRVIRAEFHLRVGDLAAAEADARALREASASSTWPAADAWSVALLGEVLVERGDLDEADGLFDGEFAAPAPALRNGPATPSLLLARGRLRRAQGRAPEAAEDLREAGIRATDMGYANPALVAWRSDLSAVLMDLGDSDEAAGLAADELSLARRSGAPRALAVALRAAARVEGPAAGIALLEKAVELLEGSPARIERARALLDLGAALRRAGDPLEARDPLRVAVELAHRCGAYALEEEALGELRATGARPRRREITGAGALTRRERRIAQQAAAGRLNREIAEDLVVTMYTVEFHLRNAYRKLGITSRTELAEALAPDAPEQQPVLALAA